MASRFVCACLPSVKGQFDPALEDNPDDLSSSAINAFLRQHCMRFLTSIGVSFNNASAGKNHLAVRRYQSVFDKIASTEYLRGLRLFVDNGGFQVQLGQLPTVQMDDYVRDFHDFLDANRDRYTYSFTLDLAPGTDNSVFATPREIFNYNLRSYRMATALPATVRDKIYCILHFRGPHLYMIWQRLLFGEGLADSFCRFATGGLAQTGGMDGIPVFSYAIPLARLILYARQRRLTALPFHILGESQPEDVLIHAVVERAVRHTHGIALNITHDSSNIFKQNLKSRVVEIPDASTRTIRKAGLHSGRMGFKDPGHASRRAEYYDVVNQALAPFELGPFAYDSHPIYEGKKTTPLGYFFLLAVAMWTYDLINTWMDEAAEGLFPVLQAGQVDDFKRGFVAALTPFLSPTKAAKLPAVADQLLAGLALLRDPDPGYLERLVAQSLRDDEYVTIQQAPLYF